MTDTQTDIKSAKNQRSGINLTAIVSSIGDPRTINLKSGGTIDVAEAIITDGEADEDKIKLALWGEDIPAVKIGDRIKITNGYTNSFKGEVSLTKGKFGQLEVVE